MQPHRRDEADTVRVHACRMRGRLCLISSPLGRIEIICATTIGQWKTHSTTILSLVAPRFLSGPVSNFMKLLSHTNWENEVRLDLKKNVNS